MAATPPNLTKVAAGLNLQSPHIRDYAIAQARLLIGNSAVIDFIREYDAVRGIAPGGESANAFAYERLIADLVAHTTRDKIRAIYMGPSDGTGFFLNDTVGWEDVDDAVLIFPGGRTFHEDIGFGRGLYHVWTGARDQPMFAITAGGAYTIELGLQWWGAWNCLTWRDGEGDAFLFDGVNNWGGPGSSIGLGSQGNLKRLRRGVICDRTKSDNAHGGLAAFYSGGCWQGAVYCIRGGFTLELGNITTAAGHIGGYIGPQASEMKVRPGFKTDGGGAIGWHCQGSFSDFEGQFEGFNGGIMLLIDRTSNTGTHDNSGRFNRIAGNFVGSDGSAQAWIVRNTAGGDMYGNKLDMPGYSNVKDQSKKADAIVLPNGPGVFQCGMDRPGMDNYRLIVGGEYR